MKFWRMAAFLMAIGLLICALGLAGAEGGGISGGLADPPQGVTATVNIENPGDCAYINYSPPGDGLVHVLFQR